MNEINYMLVNHSITPQSLLRCRTLREGLVVGLRAKLRRVLAQTWGPSEIAPLSNDGRVGRERPASSS